MIVALAVAGSAVFPTGEVHDHPREILAYIGLHGFEPAQSVVTLHENGLATAVNTGSAPTPQLELYLLQLLGALLLGAIFAKIISTANNYLFSPATNLVNDIYVRYIRREAPNREVLLVSRGMVALLGVWALYQALHTESVLKKSLYAYTIYSAALDAGDPRSVLLAPGDGPGRGRVHLYRHICDCVLGYSVRACPSTRGAGGARRDFSCPGCQPALSLSGEHRHPGAHGGPTARGHGTLRVKLQTFSKPDFHKLRPTPCIQRPIELNPRRDHHVQHAEPAFADRRTSRLQTSAYLAQPTKDPDEEEDDLEDEEDEDDEDDLDEEDDDDDGRGRG